ncbi:MAG: PAS domain-containing protein, partial [Candidatus Angelobacter sp.]
MSPRFEELVVFGVISILVALFAWIYSRDRQKSLALWMLGWVAILVHFTAPAVDDFFPRLMPYTDRIKVLTLIVAGTCFLLSVSEVFTRGKARVAFIMLIGVASALYAACLLSNFHSTVLYPALLLLSCAYGATQAIRFYSWKTAHLYLLCGLLPYGLWAAWQAFHGSPAHGLVFYLFGLFYVTGLVYLRHFHRSSPGVIFTSASFISWGCVFPLATFLSFHGVGPSPGSFFWDVPKFFVAFGMILTLFENQADVAASKARQYEMLFENNLAAVYVSTPEGKLLNCNSAFLKMYGFGSREEALAQPAIFLYSHPSERKQFLDDLGQQG